MAKKEILSAAEHFSQIRASRKNNLNGSMAPGPPNIPGQVTIQVSIPQPHYSCTAAKEYQNPREASSHRGYS